MSDPFLIAGPAIVSFSGGRTSAYMLRRILDAHGGTLLGGVHAVFANTGREMPATLDFVARCSAEWSVPVTWLEFTARRQEGYQVVSHNSAARDGEPFAALLRDQSSLPNPVARSCTTELKVRTIKRWAMGDLGWTRWLNVVGIRADETRRIPTKPPRDRWTLAHPLADAGVTKADVLAFWAAQPFDLMLKGPWEGNCDGCYLKSRAGIHRMHADYPDRMRWWAEQEAVPRGTAGKGRTFRADRESYATMAANVAASPRLIPDEILADSDGCGVHCGV
jgi:3'-phosphoadenosine 5'-phosphosulfate sulfotransferase (PAPS reductase)/FAD synthetase